METKTKPKFKAGLVLLLALADFSQEISFNFYDSQVPPLLEHYISSIAIVGFIMGIDNLLGIFMSPLMGAFSDNTRTKMGRRLPYLLIFIPLAAFAFIFIPFEQSLLSLMLAMFAYITLSLAFKAPAQALIPDFIVPEHRSKANALVKSTTAISVILAAVLSEVLYDDYPKISFAIPSVIMIICMIVVVTKVKEKDSRLFNLDTNVDESGKHVKEKIYFFKELGGVFKRENRSMLYLLFSIFFMALAWSTVRSLLTLYGMNTLELSPGEAGGMSIYAGVVFLLLVFLIAWLSEKINRLLFYKIGFVIMIVGFVFGFIFETKLLTIIATCILAVGYGFIGANAIVLVWNLAPNQKAGGTYSGIFTVFNYAAYSVGGFIVGGMIDLELLIGLNGWKLMFLNCGFFVVIGFIFALLIKPEKKEVIEATIQ